QGGQGRESSAGAAHAHPRQRAQEVSAAKPPEGVLSAPIAGSAPPNPQAWGSPSSSASVSKLSAQHLRKRYKARTVVQDVSLQVASGEVVGLLGPNGAGKTTCFYMIVGLVPVAAG